MSRNQACRRSALSGRPSPLGRVWHSTPRHMADLTPSYYLGCFFEKRYGEQVSFVYERDSRKAVVYLGDAGWQTPYAVVDGTVPDLLRSETELGWLRAWWWAATATREKA